MPLMPRMNGKAKKIAYAILGTPPNMRKGGKVKFKPEYNPNELYLGPKNNTSDLIT
jgi:hypothetical protein